MGDNLSNLKYRCKYDICKFPVEGFISNKNNKTLRYFSTGKKNTGKKNTCKIKKGLLCPNQTHNSIIRRSFSNIRKTYKIKNMNDLNNWCNIPPNVVEPYKITKKIFILWFQGFDNAPDIVKKCVKTWEFHHPGWDIIKIDHRNLKDHFDINKYLSKDQRDNMSPNHYANIIRLLLLKKYGGFWVDSTNYCVKPLESWIYPNLKEGFFAYSPSFNGGSYPPSRYIANWFIYAEKNNYIVDQWLDKSLKFWKGKISEDYKHWQPVLFYNLVRSDKKFKKIWSKVPKIPGLGPFSPLALEIDRSLTRQITTDKIYNITHKMAPFYKLTWKYSDKLEPNNVIEYLTNFKLQ